MTTMTRRMSGTSLQGFAASAEKSSKPRIKLPHEGIGSITPRPKMLRFASVKMNKRNGNQELRVEERAEIWRDVAQKEPRGFAPRGAREEQEIGISDAARGSSR